jgi:hypothetical protein
MGFRSLPVDCRPPGGNVMFSLDVGSEEAARRKPTCRDVQVINWLTRHGGVAYYFLRLLAGENFVKYLITVDNLA